MFQVQNNIIGSLLLERGEDPTAFFTPPTLFQLAVNRILEIIHCSNHREINFRTIIHHDDSLSEIVGPSYFPQCDDSSPLKSDLDTINELKNIVGQTLSCGLLGARIVNIANFERFDFTEFLSTKVQWLDNTKNNDSLKHNFLVALWSSQQKLKKTNWEVGAFDCLETGNGRLSIRRYLTENQESYLYADFYYGTLASSPSEDNTRNGRITLDRDDIDLEILIGEKNGFILGVSREFRTIFNELSEFLQMYYGSIPFRSLNPGMNLETLLNYDNSALDCLNDSRKQGHLMDHDLIDKLIRNSIE